MTCNCHTEVKGKLFAHFSAKMPEGSEKLELELQGYMFGITDDGITHRATSPVKGSYMTPKKGGGMKRVAVNTFVRATYCPFCGVAYEPAKA